LTDSFGSLNARNFAILNLAKYKNLVGLHKAVFWLKNIVCPCFQKRLQAPLAYGEYILKDILLFPQLLQFVLDILGHENKDVSVNFLPLI